MGSKFANSFFYITFTLLARHLKRNGQVPTGINFLKLKGGNMLETIIVILLVLWLIGLVGGQTLGGFLHLLLVIALVVFVIRLLTGRRAV